MNVGLYLLVMFLLFAVGLGFIVYIANKNTDERIATRKEFNDAFSTLHNVCEKINEVNKTNEETFKILGGKE
jgi:hypothetical protein